MSEFDFIQPKSQQSNNWEQPTQYVNTTPIVENYNYQEPNEFDFKPKQRAQQNIKTKPLNNAFIDVNDPRSFTNQGGNGQSNATSAYQQNLQQFSAKPRPEYTSAQNNLNSITESMDVFNDIAGTEVAPHMQQAEQIDTNDPLYGINNSIRVLSAAIRILQDIDYALPDVHKAKGEQLKKIASPILKSLIPYVEYISKLK